jgi:hypothetical protein
MLSNHFRFLTKTIKEAIYIYNIDYGVFDSNRDQRIGAIRSIDNDLKRVFNVYTFYGR